MDIICCFYTLDNSFLNQTTCTSTIYSPKSLRTLLSTLSFSGSYGWSLDGISSNEGKAAVYVSTRCLIFSAICLRQSPCTLSYSCSGSTYVLVDKQNRNILPLACEAVECLLDGFVLCLGVHDEEILLCIRRLRNVLFIVRWLDGKRLYETEVVVVGDSRRRPRAACRSLCPVVG